MSNKWIMASKTIQGVVITMVGYLATQFGWEWWTGAETAVSGLINNLIMAAGSAWTVYGMRDAVSKLKIVPKA